MYQLLEPICKIDALARSLFFNHHEIIIVQTLKAREELQTTPVFFQGWGMKEAGLSVCTIIYHPFLNHIKSISFRITHTQTTPALQKHALSSFHCACASNKKKLHHQRTRLQ
jgi:hypothetical protein